MAASSVVGGAALTGCSFGRPADLASRPVDGSAALDREQEPTGRIIPGAIDGRVLVIIDLQGGNDGLSTLVPAGSGRYHDLRPSLAVSDEDVLALDDEVGLHPSLARLHRRGITTVEGVGSIDGGLSHFDMVGRWERGDVAGTAPHLRTGFLGRLTDALDDGSPLVGLSLGGSTNHLTNQSAATMALPGADELWFLQPDSWSEAEVYRDQLEQIATSIDGADTLLGSSALAYRQLMDLALRIGPADEEIDWEHPMIAEGGELGWKLFMAADLLAADAGTRIVYAGTGDYDTHSGHDYDQMANLAELDLAVDGFLDRVEELGLADRVLVATISEFGRRVPENDTGLDHGNASTMLLAGPVADARAGDRPPLDDLDPDDNLRTTIGFDRYLASLAEEWLGVEAGSVLDGDPEPLGLF